MALGLRLQGLDAQSLWYDEGFSVYLARMNPAEITARTAADIQPPLYYQLLHGWIRLWGDRERAVRGLSVLFGVLTVPLVYAVAWQLFRRRPAGLLAALLLAISPLHIWYSQEARMYTLLTFLCLASSALLLRAVRAEGRWARLGLWAGVTLANVAALYTHYFALWILVVQALYLLWVCVGQRFRPAHLLLGGVVSGAITLAAYLPWIPHLLNRYSVDVSYWPGRLKIPEVLLDTALSFVGGESISEQVGTPLVIGYALVLLLSIAALLLAQRAEPHETHSTPSALGPTAHELGNTQYAPHATTTAPYPLAFLLLYLLVPPLLILAVSYGSPKFNARYAMISYPAVPLLLAGGLSALWQTRLARPHGRWQRGAAVLGLAFVLCVSAYASLNIYTNAAFSRADFRGVARYIRRHIEPDETILLTSGHMFPVFDYYLPGLERLLLPNSPTLDTTRTLDYSIAADLNRWLAGKGGVWVVRWQDEVVDPVGYLAEMLGEVSQPQPVHRSFNQVELEHYRLPQGARFSGQPLIAHPTELDFGDRLRLLGYTQSGDRQVTLYWQALQPLEEDYRVSLELRDAAGQSLGRWDGRPSAYLYPADRWRPGQVIFGRYDLSLAPGAPAGDYTLQVGVYTESNPGGLEVRDQAGAPLGKRVTLGPVELAPPVATEPD